ncbi:MAG: RimK/LysX family protein [Parahaliea sp.]
MLLAVLPLAGCSLFASQRNDSTQVASCPPVILQECPACEAKACPAGPVVERIIEKPVMVPTPVAATAGELNLPVIGAVEWVTLEPPGLKVEGQVDTGLDLTMLYADELQRLEKDGKRYLRFSLKNPESDTLISTESEVLRTIKVRKGDSLVDSRFIVRLWVSVGEERSLIDVSVSKRSDSDYTLLLGRNFLTDVAIVDVSRNHLLD